MDDRFFDISDMPTLPIGDDDDNANDESVQAATAARRR